MKPQILKRGFLILFTIYCMAPLAAFAAPDASPYQLIAQKNLFRLVPPVELPAEPPRPPPVKIGLQGITTALGRPLALVKLSSGVNGPEISVILGESERIGCVEVIQVDQPARTVQVLNYGEKQEFSLDTVSHVGLMPHQQIQLQGGGNVISGQQQIIFKIQNLAP